MVSKISILLLFSFFLLPSLGEASSCAKLFKQFSREITFQARVKQRFPSAFRYSFGSVNIIEDPYGLVDYPNLTDLRDFLDFETYFPLGWMSVMEVERRLEILLKILSHPQRRSMVFSSYEGNSNLNHAESLAFQLLGSKAGRGSVLELWADLVNPGLLTEVLEKLVKYEAKFFKEGPTKPDIQSQYTQVFFREMPLLMSLLKDDQALSQELAKLMADSQNALSLADQADDLPLVMQQSLEFHWLTTDEIPPLSFENVYRADRGPYTSEVYHSCHGVCEDMTSRYLELLSSLSLGARTDEGGLIYFDGVLVGVGEFIEESTFLALANVTDPKGDLILAAGMVYKISEELGHQFYEGGLGEEFVTRLHFSSQEMNFPVIPLRPIQDPESEKTTSGASFRSFVTGLREVGLSVP